MTQDKDTDMKWTKTRWKPDTEWKLSPNGKACI